MPNFHEYLDHYVGVFLILCGLCVIFFPPKFGNVYYGFVTSLTVKNVELLIIGQKLFAISTIIMGVIFFYIRGFKNKGTNPRFCEGFTTYWVMENLKIYYS